MSVTLREKLTQRDNDYTPALRQFEAAGLGWHQPSPPSQGGTAVSVVIPAHDMAYSLATTLDALDAQRTAISFEVIVVDDGSHDQTAEIAQTHDLCPTVVRLPEQRGPALARNVGTALAGGEIVLYLDADMVLPTHAIADVGARYQPGLVLVGFRHNVPFQPGPNGAGLVPGTPARLDADHRVRWTPPVGVPLAYTGITLSAPVDGRPLDGTDDFRALGHARRYYDWDLPRMVVTATVAVPRDAVVDVGGFHPAFGADGWGCDDTYLGAALIGAGLRVVPLRQLVAYHIDPPEPESSWAAKLATWPGSIATYRRLLEEPSQTRGRAAFVRETGGLLSASEVIR